jgi:hypothetical protein
MWVTIQSSQHFDQAMANVSKKFHIFFSRMPRSKRANGVAQRTGKMLLEQNGKDDRKIHKVQAPRTKPPTEEQSALVAAAATLVTW